jgi:hypothetical protein
MAMFFGFATEIMNFLEIAYGIHRFIASMHFFSFRESIKVKAMEANLGSDEAVNR